jgi:hypothetical protein
MPSGSQSATEGRPRWALSFHARARERDACRSALVRDHRARVEPWRPDSDRSGPGAPGGSRLPRRRRWTAGPGRGGSEERLAPRTGGCSRPVPATVVKPNSYDGAVCAPRLLATPDVSTEIARAVFGDQSNEPGIAARCPGIAPRWRLSLNSFRTRKPASQRPTFDFAPEEGDRLVSVHPGGRQVVRILARVTSHSGDAEDRQGKANGQRNAVPARHLQRKARTRWQGRRPCSRSARSPPAARSRSFAAITTTRTGCRAGRRGPVRKSRLAPSSDVS